MSYGAWAKKRIAELEHHRDTLFDQLLAAKEAESASFDRFKQVEHLRHELEIQVRSQQNTIRQMQVELRRFQNLTAEHDAALAQLEKANEQLKIEQRKILQLEKILNRRNGKEGYFGLSTPSALKINKPKSTPENRAKKGGAKIGHPGYGRKAFAITEADQVHMLQKLPPPCACGCSEWRPGAIKEHCVIERIPARTVKHFYSRGVNTPTLGSLF